MKKQENTLIYNRHINFFIFGYSLLLVIFVYQLFLLAYDTQNQNSIVDLLSYTVIDPPWLPNGIETRPYLFDHFFGDLQANISYSQLENPYQVMEYPWPFPPLSIYFYKTLLILGESNSYLLLILSSTVLQYISITKLFKQLTIYTKLSILIITGPLSIGWIINFDRGAVYSILFPLILIAFVKIDEAKYLQSAIIISIVISVKPQFGLILILLLIFKKFKVLFLSLGSFLLFNIISWLKIGLTLDLAVKSIQNLSQFHLGGSSGNIYVFSSISFSGFYVKILEFVYGFERALTYYNNSKGVVLILNVIILIYFIFNSLYQKLSLLNNLILWLPLVAFLPPTSQAYAASWASSAILLVLKNIIENQKVILCNKILLLLILFSIVPNILTSDKFIAGQFLLQLTSILIIFHVTLENFWYYKQSLSSAK